MSSNNKLDLDGLEHLWSKITGYIQEQIEYGSEVWIKIGKTTMGTVASTVTGAIKEIVDKLGDTTMGTTADTITGAIAEHEQDLIALNSKLNHYEGVIRTNANGFYQLTMLTSSDRPISAIVSSSNYPNGLIGLLTFTGSGDFWVKVVDSSNLNAVVNTNVYLSMEYTSLQS